MIEQGSDFILTNSSIEQIANDAIKALANRHPLLDPAINDHDKYMTYDGSISGFKEELFRDTPADDSTRRSSGLCRFYDKVLPITIPAKTVYTVKLHGSFWDSDERFSQIWRTNKIMLTYCDRKDKERKVLINQYDFSQYFANHPVKEEKH